VEVPKFRPELFGNYTLIAPIATGGMGEVFLARRRSEGFERLVVIKRILPHLTDKPEFVNMFLDEARVAAQIHHTNVCQILELGQVEGRYFMALEYLEGVSLTEVIVAGRKHPELQELRLLVSIMTQVCEGLHFAHNVQNPDGSLAQVVHRDVNPKNIFVTSAGVAKVLDFGIVKAGNALNVTRTGSVKGTYSYMSPEQIKANPVDRRSDIFSLGIVTWEALTGCRLFKRDSDFHTWHAITEEPVPAPSRYRDDIPPELDQVVLTALARDRLERYPTARELAIALESALGAGPMTPVAVAARLEAAFVDELDAQRERTKLSGATAARAPVMASEKTPTPAPPSDRLQPLSPVAPPTAIGAPVEPPRPRRRPLLIALGAAIAAGLFALAGGLFAGSDGAAPSAAGRDPGERQSASIEVPGPDAAAAAALPDAAAPSAAADAAAAATSDRVSADAAVAPADTGGREARDRQGDDPEDDPEDEQGKRGESEGRDREGRDRNVEETSRAPGFLTVDARPYGTVFVDGRELGITPIVKHRLAPGRHLVMVVSSRGDETRSFRVMIRPGKAVRKNVRW
jgi:serine/threonine protein kinase